ncbi:DUF983 domain-containing protein [Pedobacter metabolipauper]|uniref:DUF983 domain-containing protein n=1 Tax=Pedobacter metabolipauper TaxID=425513 RepID=A0A4R6SZQ6_9SPHI|nr:DUF983 domain-containing protein [Pedobacter metabolipauper]TDQ12144.1 hypothetical protein ATK78_1275 [Pedobacter metabolipauper]
MTPISKLRAIAECKCPRCRKGPIFSGRIYSFKGQVTNEYCSYCNLRFEREPGFFYVSMFISYAMNVAEMISISVAAYVLGVALTYENLWAYIAIIVVGVFLFAPLNYRYSRVFLLHWLTPGLGYVPGITQDPKIKP